MLSDQLGSTNEVTNASGVEQGRTGYYPFGKTRYSSGLQKEHDRQHLSTDPLYIGQQEDIYM